MFMGHGQHTRGSAREASEADGIFVIDGPLSVADFAAIASGRRLALSEPIRAGIAAAQARMARCIEENRLVYGVTTGFGPLANTWIDASHVEELQTNLIYHLATGVGAPLSWIEARGLMLSRLISMAQGHSGASSALVSLMIACLNAGLAPVVPEKGTVGASGDLTPCAHMALALMGQGAFLTRAGAKRDSAEVFREIGLFPHRLAHRDGLALVNGTSAMTAIATLNQARAERAIDWGFRLTAAHAEILRGKAEAWAPAFGAFRPHRGQVEAHCRLNQLIEGSQRVDRRRAAELRLQSAEFDGEGIQRREIAHQDPYTIRCAPQILGAVLDVLRFHREIVTVEMNAATDNPLFDEDEPFALHGGNFYGQHIAFAADALSPAVVKLGVLSERQLARLVDPAMNHGLPAFLQPYKTGLHSGFMGCQVTASALVAELRSQAIPASIQSIPTNANNQDVVSMGTIAARKCRNALDDLFRILAIQAMACAQAVDLETSEGAAGFSPDALSLRDFVRRSSGFLHQDRPLSGEIETLASRMTSIFEEELLP